MHKSPVLIAVILGLLFAAGEVSFSPAAGKDSSRWLDDEKTAFSEAKKENKLVLLDFTGSTWCPACQAMHKEVFSTQKFQDFAKQYVLLRVDFPNPQTVPEKGLPLVQRYTTGELGLPTILVLSADGKKLGETGYAPGGPDVFIAAVEKIAKKARH